ncbi:LolA family protein [Candidatus Liberibacter americanus]|uniref:Outer membrane lipoprotein-sorting protein n=1 Tax=Candidatus Liberibacter americanus str. Sao Paulo TaxID=1261131 RepID=U6B709_9HYPH|nr:outer membrane lipoprotein carrier protein LolA [Candidatus Liberibacter americanus]AHA27532.1 Outer membrane lipoprotein-sorting protein [Candidatus Liberibacter americanus str. Sao Paulo]EMS36507.1 lolA type protein [Candidatus Liberibacter americanus PW_SP]
MSSSFYRLIGIIKFIFLFFCSTIFYSPTYALSNIQKKNIQETIDHFVSIRTLKASFMQKDDQGNIFRGEFFMSRPGKLYFKYGHPFYLTLISDGSNIALYNSKLDSWSVYPLRNTIFELIFSNKRDKLQNSVNEIELKNEFITVFLGENSNENLISLTFSRPSYRLISWKIIDGFGNNTFVEILNYNKNININPELFVIPYDEIHNIGNK